MRKNDNGKWMIRSVRNLDSSQQRKVHMASIVVGSLVFLIYVLMLLLTDGSPGGLPMDWIFVVVFGFVALYFGGLAGRHLMVYDLGFALPTRQQAWADTLAKSHSFYANEAALYPTTDSYSNDMSINPSSGLPMSGSSGMDTSGNPFGTNAW